MSTPIASLLYLLEVDYASEELWGCHRYADTHLDKQVPLYKLTANLSV